MPKYLKSVGGIHGDLTEKKSHVNPVPRMQWLAIHVDVGPFASVLFIPNPNGPVHKGRRVDIHLLRLTIDIDI